MRVYAVVHVPPPPRTSNAILILVRERERSRQLSIAACTIILFSGRLPSLRCFYFILPSVSPALYHTLSLSLSFGMGIYFVLLN